MKKVILGKVKTEGDLLIADPCYVHGLGVEAYFMPGTHEVTGIIEDGRIMKVMVGNMRYFKRLITFKIREMDIGIDSGQVLICDTKDAKNFGGDRPAGEGIEFHQPLQDKGGKLYRFMKDFANYQSIITVYGGTTGTVNNLIRKGILEKVPRPAPDRKFDYDGCCGLTLQDTFGKVDGCGQIEDGDVKAVVSSTGYGDGVYPVYCDGKALLIAFS